jgi:hypothetical protein
MIDQINKYIVQSYNQATKEKSSFTLGSQKDAFDKANELKANRDVLAVSVERIETRCVIIPEEDWLYRRD